MFKFLKNVSREMKKVSWPKGKELSNYTVIVISTVIFVSVFFFVVDLGITQILNAFFE
ncbi:preprotein translocase subunit SecE [Oceanobacillus rekensis]|uniref:preprotein translocase subunit SecE n=1 Tax=Oceanobacillus rekensis TaxID=937927 RepID=UPI000B445C20|nr:preprotein translocase subunit SecE [Oceanobacillus rekensis]